DADLVAKRDLAALHRRRTHEAIAVEVLARLHAELALEVVPELFRAVLAHVSGVHAPEQLGHPRRQALGDDEFQTWVPLEHARPDEEPQRTSRPPRGLRGVQADVVAVL